MTPEQWLACRDPVAMLTHRQLDREDRSRKVRLFLCGCCRLIWDTLPDDRNRLAVEVGERLADGRAGPDEVSEAYAKAILGVGSSRPRSARWEAVMASTGTLTRGDRVGIGYAIRIVEITRRASPARRRTGLAEAQCDLIRDLFGDPFRPEFFDPAWATPTAVELARDIYDGRDFARMPSLGDAIEEAGCADSRILDHCRNGVGHARGCWVVDALTGRDEA
jgi:hypothetical protein